MSAELIVIDGPAGAGKSTVARRVAEEIGASMLDTGAIYRSLALVARDRGVRWSDEAGLAALADALRVEFRPPAQKGQAQRVWVRLAPPRAKPAADGDDSQRGQGSEGAVDVTREIRTPEISAGASQVSAHTRVRAALLDIQRAIAAQSLAAGRGCVAEGRDMGTVVFPHARHKFFLTASSAARARRRHEELIRRGREISLEQVEGEMVTRDERDSSRETAPLQRAEDATLVDSSELDVEQVIAEILRAVSTA